MNADRPTILISRAETIPGEDWEDYATCVAAAGGDPCALDVLVPLDIATLPSHAGVIVTGGVDIDPARYGAPRSERVTEVNPVRDEAEAALIQHALRAGLPLFCICRGFQLLNVVHRGTLLQHLEEREPHRARRGADGVSIESGWHEVTVTPGSRLASITGRAALRVNSRHHQAVETARVAPGLRATAVAPDGVVEALEVPGHPWALGVQWHPERAEMAGNPALSAGAVPLFDAFVAACRARGGG
ncbi:MAG: gamma-glutamyl-gamma-aminobutyrate hydrolase family protein [Dehalococcoidia bacterium]|nr:gamma-glutamyl-gamma-aminobutyrate hydrolase family protein [Dehalococcoidia bacterium]